VDQRQFFVKHGCVPMRISNGREDRTLNIMIPNQVSCFAI